MTQLVMESSQAETTERADTRPRNPVTTQLTSPRCPLRRTMRVGST
jgi:hypothetical protein